MDSTDGLDRRIMIEKSAGYDLCAYGSTLRLTLGCHLADKLGIALRRVGSGNRLTFAHHGEHQINEWMSRHARVTWGPADAP